MRIPPPGVVETVMRSKGYNDSHVYVVQHKIHPQLVDAKRKEKVFKLVYYVSEVVIILSSAMSVVFLTINQILNDDAHKQAFFWTGYGMIIISIVAGRTATWFHLKEKFVVLQEYLDKQLRDLWNMINLNGSYSRFDSVGEAFEYFNQCFDQHYNEMQSKTAQLHEDDGHEMQQSDDREIEVQIQ